MVDRLNYTYFVQNRTHFVYCKKKEKFSKSVSGNHTHLIGSRLYKNELHFIDKLRFLVVFHINMIINYIKHRALQIYFEAVQIYFST